MSERGDPILSTVAYEYFSSILPWNTFSWRGSLSSLLEHSNSPLSFNTLVQFLLPKGF